MNILHFLEHYWQTTKIEIDGLDSIDCMVSADWSHGKVPVISIGLGESTDESTKTSIVDECQIEVDLVTLLDAFVSSMASGESNLRITVTDTLPLSYDAMISYLEHLKSIFSEKKALYLLRNTAKQDLPTMDMPSHD